MANLFTASNVRRAAKLGWLPESDKFSYRYVGCKRPVLRSPISRNRGIAVWPKSGEPENRPLEIDKITSRGRAQSVFELAVKQA